MKDTCEKASSTLDAVAIVYLVAKWLDAVLHGIDIHVIEQYFMFCFGFF